MKAVSKRIAMLSNSMHRIGSDGKLTESRTVPGVGDEEKQKTRKKEKKKEVIVNDPS